MTHTPMEGGIDYLSLQSIDDIKRCNSLSLGMFGVGDSITNDTFKEDFEDTSSFFVDETGDTLDSATTSETTDGRFCDSL